MNDLVFDPSLLSTSTAVLFGLVSVVPVVAVSVVPVVVVVSVVDS